MLRHLEVVKTEHPNVTLWYSQVRSKLQLAMKDFVEKRITFAHDDCLYSFCSAVPTAEVDSESRFPPVDGIERG